MAASSAHESARRPFLAACLGLAHAQPIAPLWQGAWHPSQGNQEGFPAAMRIAAEGGRTRTTGAVACELAYDGLVARQAVLARIEALRDWQLRTEHWPPGTDAAHLIGLRREFDEALRIAATLPSDSYRRVRCAGQPEDRFWLLADQGRRLFAFHFPDDALGVSVGVYDRKRP